MQVDALLWPGDRLVALDGDGSSDVLDDLKSRLPARLTFTRNAMHQAEDAGQTMDRSSAIIRESSQENGGTTQEMPHDQGWSSALTPDSIEQPNHCMPAEAVSSREQVGLSVGSLMRIFEVEVT